MINNVERMFRAAKILAPEGMKDIPPYEDPLQTINPAAEAFQALERRLEQAELIIEVPKDSTSLKELLKKKLEFIEKYGGGYERPTAPFTMRLIYNGTCDRQFMASNGIEMVFNLFACCQELLDDYTIKEEPESIELHVYRVPWKHPKAESRVHPRTKDPGRGQWIPIMTFKVQEETPFFSFEELELAHEELWRMVPEYARRKMNPCGEIPLVEQKLGNFLSMQ